MSLRTYSTLSTRRRPLKPLLDKVPAREPWEIALRDPGAAPPDIATACIVSYISRRHSR